MATTKVTTDVIDMSGNTGGLVWAKGTTAQRPAVGVSTIGDLRENTETFRTEVYNNSGAWRNLKELPVTVAVDFLVVAAGGGSTGNIGGGGGAGGLRTSYTGSPNAGSGGGTSAETALSLTPGTAYTVAVGPGGAGTPTGTASNGTASSITGSDITDITTVGGGAGGQNNGALGGSGGGAARSSSPGAGTTSEGFAGGQTGGSRVAGTGGGGAGALGGDSVDNNEAGPGGLGLEVNIIGGSGNSYAGGGGGGGYNAAGGSATSGGGAGGNNTGATNTGVDGSPNTGGGAGGGQNNANSGKQGGSGIVILRCTKATATLGSGITVNSTAGPGSVNGVAISGTSDYYYSATLGTGTITFS
jgi:hypothetical protein